MDNSKSKKIHVLYITCLGHTGSTLLDMILASHSEVTSVGSVLTFTKSPHAKCNCGADSVTCCHYWQKVDIAVHDIIGLRLSELQLQSTDRNVFSSHNAAYFEAIYQVTGKRFIIDCSKSPERLNKLLHWSSLNITPIHLIRKPYGVVYSNCKKDRSWVNTSIQYTKYLLRTLYVLNKSKHFKVCYEELAVNPTKVVTTLLTELGLGFEPQQLRWASNERHGFGGNSMQFLNDSTIHLDRSWISGLTLFQKLGISILTLPAVIGVHLNDIKQASRSRFGVMD